MKKLLLLALLLGLFIGSGSAITCTWPDTINIDYDSSYSSQISCSLPNSDNPIVGYDSLEVCGDKVNINNVWNRFYEVDMSVPGDADCGLGKHAIKLNYVVDTAPRSRLGEESRTAVMDTDLVVHPKGGNPAHYGKYLYVLMNVQRYCPMFGGDCSTDATSDQDADELKGFYLTNEETTSTSEFGGEWSSSGGAIFIRQGGGSLTGLVNNGKYDRIKAGLGKKTRPNYGSIGDLISDNSYYSSNFYCDMAAANQICTVFAKQFTGENNYGPTLDAASKMTPLHRNGNYNPEGEIIRAYTAKYMDPSDDTIKGWEGPYFHICREGNLGPSGTGRVVDTNQGDPGGLYKCDTGQWFEWQDHVANVNALGKGNWIPINQCNDDLDNDGNGKADADGSPMGGMPKDPQCANRYNVNWETQAACTAGETRTVTRNVLVGPRSYEQKKFFQKCMDSKLTSGSTVAWHEHLYRTEESFEYNSEQYGVATPTGYYNNWSLAGEGGINKYFDNTGFKDASNYPDKADEVYVPSKSMTGQNYVNSGYPYYLDLNTWPSQGRWEAIFNGTNNGTIMKWGSGWVREGPHTQTLAHAKQGFLGSSSAVMCSSQGTAGSDYISGVNCSDSPPYGWIAVNKYRSKYSDQIKWRDLDDHYSYNSLIDVDTFVENESQPENNDTWTGGWVPHCSENSTLKYDITGWRCDASSSRGKMKVNFYRHSSNIGGKYTGFQINKSQLMKWKNAHPNIHAIDGSADGEKKLTVRARCWQGNASNMPADANKMIKLQAKYSGNPPLVVAGKIPSRSVPNQDTYTCVYGIQQVVYPA
ncbi:MAG: hypothetical protein ABEJ95_03020, partial [Candidatus Nanohalobium sp.]